MNSSLPMKLEHDHQLLAENISCLQCWRLIINLRRPDQLFTNGTQQPHSQLWLENGLAGIKNRPTEQNSFSLVLYNISSLRMHLEDLMEHISASYPNIWALTGLHCNDDVNYQLASYFKSRYTIYYQHGSNSFGGVCLAIAREVPHRIASEFNNINNLIAADVFNSNKKYTVAVVYSPPSEEVPIDILNRLHRYNRNLLLIGDLNARHFNWHDETSNSCCHRLAKWIEAKQNLKIFNSAKPTSTRSQAVIDLIVAPSHVSSELAEIDQKMRVTDHYPVH